MRPLPPDDEQALLRHALQLEGRSVSELAEHAGWQPPSPRRMDCGWVGRLMESVLGASAGPKPEPDFPELGVELKTIPVGFNGKPRAPSFLCSVQLPLPQPDWQQSLPFKKLARMLWIPIIGKSGQSPGSRRVGAARLFVPDGQQLAILRSDWQDIMEYLHIEGEVNPQCGQWLCVRASKATRSASRVLKFCLRPALTSQIVNC